MAKRKQREVVKQTKQARTHTNHLPGAPLPGRKYKGKSRKPGIKKVPTATAHLSGTPEKLAVLIERERLGQELSAPGDATPTDARHADWGFEGSSLRPRVKKGSDGSTEGIVVAESRFDNCQKKDTFGSRLRSAREKAKLSRKALALRSGLTESGLSLLERDKRTPRLDVAVILATTLRVSLDALVGINPAAL